MSHSRLITAGLAATGSAFFAAHHASAVYEPQTVTTVNVNTSDPDTDGANFIQGATYDNGVFSVLWSSVSGSEIVQVDTLGDAPGGDVSPVMTFFDWNFGPAGSDFASTGNFLGRFASGKFVFPTIGDDSVFTFDETAAAGSKVAVLADDAAIDTATGDSTSFIQYSAYNAQTDALYFINNDSSPGEGGVFKVTNTGTVTEEAGDGAVTSAISALPDFDIEALTVTGPAGGETFYFGSNDTESIYAFDNAADTANVLLDLGAALNNPAGVSSTTLGGDGRLYFFEFISDSIYSVDPLAADVLSTLEVVMPAGDIAFTTGGGLSVGQLIWTDIDGGLLAFTQTDNNNGVAGVYLVPEPASLALLALGCMSMCGRRRRG